MSIKLKKLLPSIFSLSMLMFTIVVVSILYYDREGKKDEKILEAINDSNRSEMLDIKDDSSELRATWIPFMDLSVKGEFSEEKFKQNYVNILNKVLNTKLNTVFVQVRPFCDALYPSKIYPWSHIITGEQGADPGFDPLKFMIEETHSRNLKFHAWIVPMRIISKNSKIHLAENNPYMKWKNEDPDKFNKYIMHDENFIYWDPQYDEVKKLIIDGVKEIVENYDVDGVNFDDYFYPADNLWVDKKDNNLSKDAILDDETMKKRKDSVNSLVREVYSAVKSIKKDVLFGICPQGNFSNARRAGSDIDKWAVEEGYVDYLCPEIYTNSVNPVLPFEKAASDWRALVTNNKIKLYAGLGLYKTGTDEYDKGTWLGSDDIIMKQIEFLRKEGYDGFSLYSSAYLDTAENKNEILNVIKVIN